MPARFVRKENLLPTWVTVLVFWFGMSSTWNHRRVNSGEQECFNMFLLIMWIPRKLSTLIILLFYNFYFTFWAFSYYHLELQGARSHEKDQKFLVGIQNPCSKDYFCIEINSWKIAWVCNFQTETWISYRKRKS